MPTLFDSLNLGDLTLDNRIALAPMTRSRGTDDHVQEPLAATYYAQRASAGLLITEGVPISQQAVGYIRVPGIWSDEQVEAWKPVTAAVHERGGRIFAQIWHVGRVSHTAFQPDGRAPVGPSPIAADAQAYTPDGFAPTSLPEELTVEGIAAIVSEFVRAAENAVAAGFDGVEIHGANGYLLEQFLFSGSNQRTDGYGGSPENRSRFTLEVVDAVIAAIGGHRVGLRISPQNTFNDAFDADRAGTFAALVPELAHRDLAILHVVEPVNTAEADRLLPSIREQYRGVLITNGGYDGEAARAVLERDEADIVAFGSTFLANPDLPARLRLGAPLNPPNPDTFYTPGPEGYTDYPTLDTQHVRVVALQVTDDEGYRSYRRAMGRVLATYGGDFSLDVQASTVLRPEVVRANRVFILGFPSAEAADAFFADPRYQAIRREHFEPSVGDVAEIGRYTRANLG